MLTLAGNEIVQIKTMCMMFSLSVTKYWEKSS